MPINVCIDVDLTLVDQDGELLPGAKEALAKLIETGCELTLWSSAGAAYAKTVSVRHNLEKYFEGFAGKPDIAIDDDPQSLIIRQILVKKPKEHWNEVEQQAIRVIQQIRDAL